jgi:hypothetical protein
MITTRAQISKGAIWLGGNIGYNQNKDAPGDQSNSYKYTSFNISPAIGKVVKDNLVIGFNLLYGQNNTEHIQVGIKNEVKVSNYGGGVLVRQYVPVVSRLYIFGDANAGFTLLKTDYINTYNSSISKSTSKGWAANLGITPGLSYGITKKLHLETSLSNLFAISYTKSKSSGDKYHRFSTGLATDGKAQFNIGCRFLFNNKG